MLPLKLSSHIDHGGHHAKHRYNYLLVFLNNPDMSFRLLDLLPSFLPQTIDPHGHYSINGCSTATQKPNGPSRSHQSCGNLQPCSKIPLQDKNVFFCFFLKRIFTCAHQYRMWQQRPGQPFLTAQSFCKYSETNTFTNLQQPWNPEDYQRINRR